MSWEYVLLIPASGVAKQGTRNSARQLLASYIIPTTGLNRRFMLRFVPYGTGCILLYVAAKHLFRSVSVKGATTML